MFGDPTGAIEDDHLETCAGRVATTGGTISHPK
jgi:hypothetical protein